MMSEGKSFVWDREKLTLSVHNFFSASSPAANRKRKSEQTNIIKKTLQFPYIMNEQIGTANMIAINCIKCHDINVKRIVYLVRRQLYIIFEKAIRLLCVESHQSVNGIIVCGSSSSAALAKLVLRQVGALHFAQMLAYKIEMNANKHAICACKLFFYLMVSTWRTNRTEQFSVTKSSNVSRPHSNEYNNLISV